MRLLILKRELIFHQAGNNPISYTFPYSPIVASGKEYSIKFFKEVFRKKKNKEDLKGIKLLPKQSNITQNIKVQIYISQ